MKYDEEEPWLKGPRRDKDPFKPMSSLIEGKDSDTESLDGSGSDDLSVSDDDSYSLDGFETAKDDDAELDAEEVRDTVAPGSVFDFDESRGLHPVTHESIAKAQAAAEARGLAEGTDGFIEGQDQFLEYARHTPHSKPHGEETFDPVGVDRVRSFGTYLFWDGKDVPENRLFTPKDSRRGEDAMSDEFVEAVTIRDRERAASAPKKFSGTRVSFAGAEHPDAETKVVQPTKAIIFPITSAASDIGSVLDEVGRHDVEEAKALFRSASRQKASLALPAEAGKGILKKPSAEAGKGILKKPSASGIV